MDCYYIEESLVNEIRKESYESIIESVMSAIDFQKDKIFGGDDIFYEKVATFKNHVVLADESSNLYRVSFEYSDGKAAIGDVEKIDSKKVSHEEAVNKSLDRISEEIVNMIDNSTVECQNKLKEKISEILEMSSGSINGYKRFKKN
jgi:hypothetical protein